MKDIIKFYMIVLVVFVIFAVGVGKNISFSKTLIALSEIEPPNIEEVVDKWSEEIDYIEVEPEFTFEYIKAYSTNFFNEMGLFFKKLWFSISYFFELLIYPLELFGAFFSSLY